MLKRAYRMTLKSEVFLLSLAYALVFSLVFILIIGSVLFTARLNEMKAKLQGSNAQILTYMDTLFSGSRSLLEYFDETADLTARDAQERQEILSMFRDIQSSVPDVLSVFIGYRDGSLLVNDYLIPEDYDATQRSWYREAAEKYPDVAIAFPYREYSTGEWCFCSAKALAGASDGIEAVVAVDYSVETLYENAILHSEYDAQINYLVNEDGVCIYHPSKELIGTHIAESRRGEPETFPDQEGYVEYDLNGVPQIAFYHRLSGSDSILVSSVARSDVFVPALNGVINSILGLLLLSVLMAAAFMTVFDHRYGVPVRSLKERLAALLRGERIADVPGLYPNRELLEIADSMEKLTESTLNRKAEELNAILESSSDGILVLDRGDRILHYNGQLLNLWELPGDAVYGKYDDLGLDRLLIPGCDCTHPTAQAQKTEMCYLLSGRILERYARVLTEREHIDGILCVYRDATEKVKKEERLTEIANTDFLTGLNNRRSFAVQAAYALRKARETGEALALLMIDIDDFKLINDAFGHDAGDKALKAFAMQLRQCSRRSDILGRYGGEEFCVLLPDTDAETAYGIAERMRLHSEDSAVDHQDRKISWTISIGVAHAGDGAATMETLLKHADIACYQAKQEGRNRVKAYGGPGAERASATE